MKNYASLLLAGLFFFATGSVTGQSGPEYGLHRRAADSLLALGHYRPAAERYSAAFAAFGWKGYASDRFNAARAWTRAGVPDSAFYQLDRLASKGSFADWKSLLTTADFAALRADARWAPLYAAVRKNSGIDEARYNEALVLRLDSLVRADQRWRNRLTELRNTRPDDTLARQETLAGMTYVDSLNYFELRRMLETYGFPNYEIVGMDGTHNFWLLMQHQDRHPDFQQQVLAMMEKEVARGKASGQDYAYLLDRVRVNTGQLQVYGTQMQVNATETSFEPKPVEDPEKLNERRASVGLGTIEAYIETMNRNYHGRLKKH